MGHLSQPQLQELKQILISKKEKLKDYLETLEEEDPRSYPDRTNDNAESGEEALEDYEMIENEVLEGNAEEMLAEIEAALQRMEEGTYGQDTETGEDIPYARLKLYPTAKHTVSNTPPDED